MNVPPRPVALARHPRWPLRCALSLSPLLLLPAPSEARPETRPLAAEAVRFKIPPGALADALTAFARQSGLRVAADASLMSDQRSTGVNASLPPEQALRQILAGTGLRYTLEATGIAVQPGPEKAPGRTATLQISGDVTEGQSTWGLNDADSVYLESGSRVHLDRQQIERFRGQSIGDMLAGAVGVYTADVRNGAALDVNIRGIQGQSRVPVIIDGGQQAIDVYRGYAGVQQRSYLDPDLISEISIEKGPGLAANASGAIGGVVNMETLHAGDILSDKQRWGLRLRGGIADNSIERTDAYKQVARGDSYRKTLFEPRDYNGSLALAHRSEHWQLVAAYTHRHQANYFAGREGVHRYDKKRYSNGGNGLSSSPVSETFRPGDEVLNTDTANQSTLLKITWSPNADHELEASHRWFNSSFGEIMPSAIARVPESTQSEHFVDPPGSMVQFLPGRMRLQAGSLRHHFHPQDQDWIDLRSTLWMTRATSRMYNSNIANTPLFKPYPTDGMPDTLGATYAPGLQSDVKSRRWGLDSSNASYFHNALGEWTLRTGLATQHEDTAPNSPVVAIDYNNNRYLRSGVRSESSAVASLQWQPRDWLSLTVGGRYTRYKTRDRNRIAYVSASTPVRYTFARLYKDGAPLPGEWYKEWFPDAQGRYTEASLRATPYAGSTVGQSFDFDEYRPDPRGEGGFFTKQIPTAWGYQPAIRRSGQGFAPYVDLRFNLDPDMFFYVKYAQGWKMPSLFESTLGNSTSRPVTDLKPEKNLSWDVGFSLLKHDVWRDNDRLAFKLAWFDNNIKNAITRRFALSTWNFYVENVDSYRVNGFEWQSGYDFGHAYVDLSANYNLKARTCDAATARQIRTAAYAAYTGADKTPDCVNGGFGTSFVNNQNPPRYSIQTTLGLRLLNRHLEAGVRRLQHSGPTHLLNKPWNTGGYTGLQNVYLATEVYDLFTQWRIDKRNQLEFVVNNLLDSYYLDPMAMSLMPAPGRTLRLNYTLRL